MSHLPVYPFKGGNMTGGDFAAQLAAIEDSLPERNRPLSAIEAVAELVSNYDMRFITRKPELAQPLLHTVNAIMAAHESSHTHTGLENGLKDIQLMNQAMNLREQLEAAPVSRLRIFRGEGEAGRASHAKERNTHMRIFSPEGKSAPSR